MSSYKKYKVSNNKTLMEQVTEYIMKMAVFIYLFAIFAIFPFYNENHYSKLGASKYHFFVVSSVIFLAVMIINSIFYSKSHFEKDIYLEKYGKFSITDKFAIAFLLITAVSNIFAMDTYVGFWGDPGWYMGLLAQTIFVMLLFFISRFWEWDAIIIEVMMIAAACVFLIAIFQRFNIDLFDLYYFEKDGYRVHVNETDVEKFVSTLGQTSWYSGYEVLVIPFGMFWYFHDSKVVSRIFSGIFLAISACSICTVNNDSAYVAMFGVFSVFFWFALEDNEKLLRLLEMVLIFLGSFRLIGILQDLFPERRIKLITGEEKITEFLNHSPIMAGLLIFLALIYIVLRMLWNSSNKTNNKTTEETEKRKNNIRLIRTVYIWLVVICVWAVILLMILTTNKKLPDWLSFLYNVGFFNFDYHWGNQRGFNWRYALKAIRVGKFKEWLIGVGPDNFKMCMTAHFSQDIRAFWGDRTLACAHNEWLNMAVNEGILGLIAYAGIFATSLARLGKTIKNEPMAMPFFAAVLSYVLYNIFCYQQCISTTMIFIFMGMGEMIILHSQKEMEKKVKK